MCLKPDDKIIIRRNHITQMSNCTEMLTKENNKEDEQEVKMEKSDKRKTKTKYLKQNKSPGGYDARKHIN